MPEKRVLYKVEDNVGFITINNPPMNALCKEVMDGLNQCLSKIEKDGTLRAVVITGEGRAFVAGADIKEFPRWTPDVAEELTSKGHRIFNRIEALYCPVIAAVNGYALGGGLELALVCDIRIASEKAKFGLPEVTLGIIPGYGGTQRLSRTIGVGKARMMTYTGEIIGAGEALEIKLVEDVVEAESLMEAARGLARKIAANAPIAVKGAKKAINQGRNLSLEQGLAIELAEQIVCFSSEDKQEGVEAFINKRTPEFKNR